MNDIDLRSQAHRAIQQLAADQGLPTDLTILSDRWNTLARLGESDVIAKAATLAHLSRIDPLHWFEQEVRVSAQLSANGAPVQVPWAGAACCHLSTGMPITLWQRIEGEMAGSTETEMVDSLAELHRLGNDIVLDQPWFATITVEIAGTLAMLTDRGVLDSFRLCALGDYCTQLLDTVDAANLPGGFVHGDAQRKNSMHTASGPIWIDLEETCHGPYAWDLACLTTNPMFDVERVLDRYAHVSGTNRVITRDLDVLKQLRDLEGLVWMLAIQEERDSMFRDETSVQLARVLNAANAG